MISPNPMEKNKNYSRFNKIIEGTKNENEITVNNILAIILTFNEENAGIRRNVVRI